MSKPTFFASLRLEHSTGCEDLLMPLTDREARGERGGGSEWHVHVNQRAFAGVCLQSVQHLQYASCRQHNVDLIVEVLPEQMPLHALAESLCEVGLQQSFLLRALATVATVSACLPRP